MTTCQICERAIKANTGVIAHHGYQRPGDGWQTSSCYGARHLPYEQSRDRLGEYIQIVEQDLAGRTETLRKLDAGEIPYKLHKRVKGNAYMNFAWVDPEPGEEVPEFRRREYRNHLAWGLKQVQQELERAKKRYDAWAPSQPAAELLAEADSEIEAGADPKP